MLADALQTLLSDESLSRRLGNAGRKRAVEEFDERAVIRQTMVLYRDLLRQTNFTHTAG